MFFRAMLACALLACLCPWTTSAEPATVAQAAEKLDLVTLPLPASAEMSGYRREAELSYLVQQPANQAFEFVHKQLTELGWEQMPGSQDYGEFVNGDYQRDGLVAHVSVSPRSAGTVGVILSHKGNVPLDELPVPANAEKLYTFTGIIIYKSPDPVAATASACRRMMLEEGWTPYGEAGDSDYFRKNAVQANVRVMSAPAQAGATMINLSTQMLSLELPAPSFADDFRYTDGTTTIFYDCDKTQEESAEFYRVALEPLGWTATTDKPIPIRWEKHTLFRNASQDMITVRTHDFEGRTRTWLEHQNVAEVAGEELRGLIAAGEKATYKQGIEWLPVVLTLPAGAAAEQVEDWAVKVPVARGQAFATAESIVASLASAGWKTDGKPSDAPHLRTTRLERQGRVLHVLALDPPKRDAWVAAVGLQGVKLKVGE